MVACFGSGSGVATPTFAGKPLTQVVIENVNGAAEIWVLFNPPVGIGSFVGGGNFSLSEVLGVAGVGNTGVAFSNVAGNPSVSITPLSAKGIYFSVASGVGTGVAATMNPQNGQTQILGTTGAPAYSSAFLIFSAGTAQTLSYQPLNFSAGGNSSLAVAEFRSGQQFVINDAVTSVEKSVAQHGAIFTLKDIVTVVELNSFSFLRGATFTILEHVTVVEKYTQKLVWTLVSAVTSLWNDTPRT